MPHLIIEYAQKVIADDQVEIILDHVYQALVSTEIFEADNIKLRAIPVQFYRIGQGEKTFIHVQIRMHVGRSNQQKKRLSSTVLMAMREQALKADVMTVEVIDMDKETYAKYVK